MVREYILARHSVSGFLRAGTLAVATLALSYLCLDFVKSSLRSMVDFDYNGRVTQTRKFSTLKLGRSLEGDIISQRN